MKSLAPRILLVLALVMNGIMVAQADVLSSVSEQGADALGVMAQSPDCHDASTDSTASQQGGAMTCCQSGHCHCLVVQAMGGESALPLAVPASPVPVTSAVSYRSPVFPLMLRPPIA